MLYVFCVVLCVSPCTGHFVMVPLNLTYLHCLQILYLNISSIYIVPGAFVVSWTPYVFAAMWVTFHGLENTSSSVVLVPAVIAKCSIIWNPIIYIYRNRRYRDIICGEINKQCQNIGCIKKLPAKPRKLSKERISCKASNRLKENNQKDQQPLVSSHFLMDSAPTSPRQNINRHTSIVLASLVDTCV